MAAPRVVLSEHAREHAARRGIAESLVVDVATTPEQVIAIGRRREVRQSRVVLPGGRIHLVRVIAEATGRDIRVVTVYRTSKVDRYWRAQ